MHSDQQLIDTVMLSELGHHSHQLAESIYDISVRRNIKDEYFDKFHFEQYGGVPVLGVSKPVIIGHGISESIAFNNMILMAEKMIETSLMDKIKASFAPQS